MDLEKTIRQHLQSLARFGVESIPSGTGRFKFGLESGEEVTSERGQTTTAATSVQSDSSVTSAASGVVQEASASYVETSNSSPEQIPKPAASPRKPPSELFSASDNYGPSLSLSDRQSALNVLQDEVAGCTRCAQLVANRTQTVFGVGNITPRLVFLGEGPGADEDRQGEPFVGAAGKLLNKIMAASKIQRDDVYILNTVKCRPPGNRNPSPEELVNCWGYAEQQLEILQPEFICCLGSVAAKRLLNTTQSLGRLRRRFHQYRGSRVVVTYHPAYLLRTESAKRHVWEDMKMLMKEMGVEL